MSKGSSSLMIGGRSLLSLCEPPEGFTFVRGAWATHDLDLLAVSDHIAPALAGSVATQQRQRRLEGRTTPDGHSRRLLIFPCSEQRSFRGFVPWCHVYPIGGRRQHAKFALLQFESPSGGRTITRAIVTSANLTNSGIRRNREILAWEEVGHLAKKASVGLGQGILREFRALAQYSGFQSKCKSLLDDMAAYIQTNEFLVLRSSVGKSRPLLYDLSIRKPAKRIVIVSPPFGSNTDDGPVDLMSKYIGPKTVVEIYTGANFLQGQVPGKDNGPEFSTKVLTEFSARAKTVQIHAVPELVPDLDAPNERPPIRRKLHAKLIALVDDDGELDFLLGSANFTRSALEGKNRELMLYLGGKEQDLNALLADLHAAPYSRTAVRPSQVVEARTETLELPALRAVFTVDPSESSQHQRLRGRLRLIGDDHPVQMRYRGETLQSVEEQGLWLNECDTCLEVTMADGRTRNLCIHVEAADPQIWNRISHEDADVRPDKSWQHLLLDLRKDSRRTPVTTVQPPIRPGQPADGFYIPLEQRLVTLARHRHRLRVFAGSNELAQQLNRYFEGQDEALQVARALIGASCDLAMDKKDRLLVALREAMPLFEAQEISLA